MASFAALSTAHAPPPPPPPEALPHDPSENALATACCPPPVLPWKRPTKAVLGFRAAHEYEDEQLAGIITNAFRLNWDPNWWQDLSSPLRAIRGTADKQLDANQVARLNIYRSVIRLTRIIGGSVDVATLNNTTPVAVSCWFPPHVRPSVFAMWRAGMVNAWLGTGMTGIYRLAQFAMILESLQTSSVSRLGRRHADGAYVEIVATDPTRTGHGYARSLIAWQIERHRAQFPGVPVYLDTATDQAARVYRRLGFREIGRKEMGLSLDRNGFREKEKLSKEEKRERAGWHYFVVMVLDAKSEDWVDDDRYD